MGFLLYLIGFIVFITGAAWLATLAGVSQTLVLGAAVVLLVIAVLSATARARAGI